MVNNDKGFSLMECLVAMMVFSIGLLMIAAVLPFAMHSANRSASHTRASELAAERAELVIRSRYADADNDPGMHVDPASHDGYTVSWNVEDNNPAWYCKRVTVSVTKDSDPTQNAKLVCVTTKATL